MLGNPILLDDIDYTQDKMTILKERINKISDDEFCILVEEYTKLIKKLWGFVVNERIYNFAVNNGYNKNNEMVLIDFNEVTFDIEEVKRDIQNKTWLGKSSYLRLNNKRRDIFRNLMQKEITEEKLRKCWRVN